MPYVARDAKGKIKAVYATKSPVASEKIAADEAELHSFFSRIASTQEYKKQLNNTDQLMLRVLEDLIETLVAKKIVSYNDFNSQVQQKLMSRKDIRWKMQHEDIANFDDLSYLTGEEDDDAVIESVRRGNGYFDS